LWTEASTFFPAEQSNRHLQFNLFDHQRVEVDLVVLEGGEVEILFSEFHFAGPFLDVPGQIFGWRVEQVEVDAEREAHFGEAPITRPLDGALE
jgi:hypothetical protein